MLPASYYQRGTSGVQAAYLFGNLLAGVVGDLLVVLGGASLNLLMWISAVSVCLGVGVGCAVLSRRHTFNTKRGIHVPDEMGDNATDTAPSEGVSVDYLAVAEKGSFYNSANQLGAARGDETEAVPVREGLAKTSTSADSSPVVADSNSKHSLVLPSASSEPSRRSEHDAFMLERRKRSYRAKLVLFGRQLLFLKRALQSSRPLMLLLIYWIIGNSVFMVS